MKIVGRLTVAPAAITNSPDSSGDGRHLSDGNLSHTSIRYKYDSPPAQYDATASVKYNSINLQ